MTTPALLLHTLLLLAITRSALCFPQSGGGYDFPENCSFAVLGISRRLYPVIMCRDWAPLCSCTYFDTREIITIVLWGAFALFIVFVPKKMSCPARIAYTFISLWMSAVWEFSCLALIIYLIFQVGLHAMIYFNRVFDQCLERRGCHRIAAAAVP
jgi:hypothetical protein